MKEWFDEGMIRWRNDSMEEWFELQFSFIGRQQALIFCFQKIIKDVDDDDHRDDKNSKNDKQDKKNKTICKLYCLCQMHTWTRSGVTMVS